ncbi:hypothetical protein L1987_46565 [Smallanthus sonchifolius]|uniref:Uncharacterized protein n=1 Tax=Smallanthus sonchifolius TaxID=185202 RepID=A0ACB9G123_9ASTR|nr:hypothetical protein L1987_46565 [Smallanthus sonchifolius]
MKSLEQHKALLLNTLLFKKGFNQQLQSKLNLCLRGRLFYKNKMPLQQDVEGLTNLVSSLTTTVQDQPKEINRLKLKNKKLQYSHPSSSKPFKRLMRGPSKPSCKNSRVSSSSSELDDAERQGDKLDDVTEEGDGVDVEGVNLDAGYGSSPCHQQYPILPDMPETNVSESIGSTTENSDLHMNVSVKDKGKGIVVEEEEHLIHKPKPRLDKALEEDMSRQTILDMQTKDFYDDMQAKVQVEANMAEVAASWLASIMVEELENKVVERLKKEAKNVTKLYLRRKSLKETTVEVVKSTPEVVITPEVIITPRVVHTEGISKEVIPEAPEIASKGVNPDTLKVTPEVIPAITSTPQTTSAQKEIVC